MIHPLDRAPALASCIVLALCAACAPPSRDAGASEIEDPAGLRTMADVPRTARVAELGFAIGVTVSFEKVFADPPFGFTGRFEGDIEISLARNEVEASQVVLFPERDVPDVTLEVTALTGPGGATIEPADIDVRVVGYLNLLAPKVAGGRTGWHPDPLLPNRALDLAAGVPQPFLIAVHARAETAPGSYEGRLIVRTGEGAVETRALRVVVWDVTLPRVPRFKSSSFASWEALDRMWPLGPDGVRFDDERRLELMLRIADLAFDYRLPPTLFLANGLKSWNGAGEGNTTYGFPTHDPRPGGRPVFDPERTDRLIDYMLDRGANHFFIAATANVWRPASAAPGRRDRLVEYLTDYRDHLRDRGLLDMAYVYDIDEPWGDEVDDARRTFELIRERVGPGLRVMQNTNQNNPTILSDLIGAFDVADINLGFYDVTAAASYRRLYPDAFAELWWNVNLWPDSHPNLFLEYPLTDARIIGPMSYAYGISGFEYWGLLSPGGIAAFHPIEPDERRVRWDVGAHSLDGTLVYPGTDFALYPSMRLASLRDGFEDLEMLYLLEDVAPQSPLLDVPIVRGLTEFVRDPTTLLAFRRSVAEAIVSAGG